MDLLEYQAKELFREIGIPVLPSQRIDNPREIKGLQLPYPVVLKSQVRAGGRGRAGGVRFVENTIDAIAAARTIFNLPILGEYPKVLLAEAKYDADREFYLAVVLDYVARRPVLLGSPQGGINVEAVMEQVQQVVVDQEFSPFYARRLAIAMGLTGTLIQSVSDIIEKMYQLFVQKDLDLVEINPLGVSSTNQVMALDGKIAANDDALERHQDLLLLASKMTFSSPDGRVHPTTAEVMSLRDTIPHKQVVSKPPRSGVFPSSSWVNREGNIGIICNGSSLAMATLDLLYQAEGKAAICLVVGEESAASYSEQLPLALEQVTQAKGVKVVLVNIVGSRASGEEVGGAIATYLQRKIDEKSVQGAASPPGMPKFVVRLLGGEINPSLEPVADLPVEWMANLDEAIALAVSLTKSTAKRS